MVYNDLHWQSSCSIGLCGWLLLSHFLEKGWMSINYDLEQELDRLEHREDRALAKYVLEFVKLHQERHVMLKHHHNNASQLELARPVEKLPQGPDMSEKPEHGQGSTVSPTTSRKTETIEMTELTVSDRVTFSGRMGTKTLRNQDCIK